MPLFVAQRFCCHFLKSFGRERYFWFFTVLLALDFRVGLIQAMQVFTSGMHCPVPCGSLHSPWREINSFILLKIIIIILNCYILGQDQYHHHRCGFGELYSSHPMLLWTAPGCELLLLLVFSFAASGVFLSCSMKLVWCLSGLLLISMFWPAAFKNEELVVPLQPAEVLSKGQLCAAMSCSVEKLTPRCGYHS